MKNLNIYILLAGCCIGNFIVLDTMAATFDCQKINSSCSTLGYRDAKSSCPGGYIACPFNTAAAVCDREADDKDYVFSRLFSPVESSGWSNKTSNYNFYNYFVVGYSGSATKCSKGSVLGYGTGFLASHTHNPVNTNMTGLSAVKQNRDGATGYTADIWTSYTTVASGVLGQTNSLTSFGETITGGSTVPSPVHKYSRMFSYTNPITEYTGTSSTIPSSKPSCTSLGYSDTKFKCPGSYVKCPYATALEDYVMCDMQAKVGEIKFSLQTADHDGWLLCDGRSLSSLGTSYANSELKTVLSLTALPDYRGAFLKIYDYEKGGDPYTDNIPYHNHDIIAASMSKRSAHSSQNHCNSGCKGTWYAAKGANAGPVAQTTKLSTYQQTTFNGIETAPEHYVANVFIYSGKLGGK